jgi:outer membrane receptor protein involved in Fe transport
MTGGPLSRWARTVAAALALAVPAGAEEPNPESAPFTEEIVVSATRRPEASRRLPASVTIVDGERLEATVAMAVSDVLEREVPGFHLLNPGLTGLYGAPQTRSVSLRGLGGSAGSRTLVLLDGVPLVDPLQGTVDWNRVPLENIERVEVVRTATATAWGNLALGGVIHILTRDPVDRRLVVEGETGELGLLRGEVFAAEPRGRHGLSLAARALESDGYVLIHEDYRGPVDVPRRVEQESAAAEWHVDGPTGSSFSLGADWSSDRRGHDDLLVSDTIQQMGMRGAAQWHRGSSLWEGRLYGQRLDLPGRRGAPNAGRTAVTRNSDLFDVPGTTAGATVQWSREAGPRHLFTAGGDVTEGSIEVHDDFRFVAGAATRRRSYAGTSRLSGLFAQETYRAGERWSVHLGVRVEDWRLSGGWRNQRDLATGVETARNDFADRSRTVIDPTLGVVYQAGASTALRVSLFSGFRAATLADLYRATRGTLESNPALEPERLRGAEVGAHWSGGRASLDAALFWNVVSDPIVNRTIGVAGPGGAVIPPCGAIAAGAICRQKDNLGEAVSRGVELVAGWNPSPRWTMRGTYAYVDSTVTESPGAEALIGNRLRYVPDHTVTASLGWSAPRRIEAALQVRFTSQRYDDDLNVFPLDEFTLVDLRVARSFGAATTIFVNARNLLDEQPMVTREIVQAEIGPPRQVGAGVRVRLGG